MIPGVTPQLVGLFPGVVEVTLASGGAVDASTLFTPADWSGPLLKRVIIPAGVTRGSSSNGTPAFKTGMGRGGKLEIVLNGSLRGAGGPANSGTGGDAMVANQSGVTLLGSGSLYGGGGGGGVGGQGGQGDYTYTAQDGPIYQTAAPAYYATLVEGIYGNQYHAYWAGTDVTGGKLPQIVGGCTYYYGAQDHVSGSGPTATYYYAIYRQYPATAYTTGGAGGSGGRGQGYDGANTGGSAGAAGGTNAGTGGTGGTGGGWGTAGNTGNTGASGNYTAGSAGAAGGAAGYALRNLSNVDKTKFTGSLAGPEG